MKLRLHNLTQRFRLSHRRGFTAIELLVVISIIVVILGITMPLLNVLNGNKSLDAAQNILSSSLQRVRGRAIAMQEARGLLFFRDQQNGKVALIPVRLGTLAASNSAIWPVELDGTYSEFEYLPTGVGLAGTYGITRDFGLVLFDGYGRIQLRNFNFGSSLASSPKLPGDPGSNMAAQSSGGIQSIVALLFYDQQAFSSVNPAGSYSITLATNQSDWLEQNSVAVVVNRYNGTLIRGE